MIPAQPPASARVILARTRHRVTPETGETFPQYIWEWGVQGWCWFSPIHGVRAGTSAAWTCLGWVFKLLFQQSLQCIHNNRKMLERHLDRCGLNGSKQIWGTNWISFAFHADYGFHCTLTLGATHTRAISVADFIARTPILVGLAPFTLEISQNKNNKTNPSSPLLPCYQHLRWVLPPELKHLYRRELNPNFSCHRTIDFVQNMLQSKLLTDK